MIKTPIGNLIVEKNGEVIEYRAIPQPLCVIEGCDYYVDARYLIRIDTTTIKAGDIVKCFIDCEDVTVDGNGGEMLALLDFYKDNFLVSLGGYEILEKELEKKFAFDLYQVEKGLEAYFIDTKYKEELKFAISWMDINSGIDENSTWYASDPDICHE
ncbi:MAG: hypothetical protein ACRC3Y_11960 [Romboutsia sp.]|uniref:hypothetical protein n=1 Tax=Romboutsia sp. TaxID=1965302 RepID=UPI003F2B3F07